MNIQQQTLTCEMLTSLSLLGAGLFVHWTFFALFLIVTGFFIASRYEHEIISWVYGEDV